MRYWIIVAVVGALLVSCGEPGPSDADLRSSFALEHPGAEIVKIEHDGPDASTEYIRFHYRIASHDDVMVETWQFTDSGKGKKKRVIIPPSRV